MSLLKQVFPNMICFECSNVVNTDINKTTPKGIKIHLDNGTTICANTIREAISLHLNTLLEALPCYEYAIEDGGIGYNGVFRHLYENGKQIYGYDVIESR